MYFKFCLGNKFLEDNVFVLYLAQPYYSINWLKPLSFCPGICESPQMEVLIARSYQTTGIATPPVSPEKKKRAISGNAFKLSPVTHTMTIPFPGILLYESNL